MTVLDDLSIALRSYGLMIMGGCRPVAKDELPDTVKTVILIGPDGDRMWPVFTKASEYRDTRPDPLDRWSKRVIGTVATQFQAKTAFPSDGPPYPPFIDWALRSGRAFVSPVQLLVHDVAGLMVSYRGAFLLPHAIPLEINVPSPCLSCESRPCLHACPIGAMTEPGGYAVDACKQHITNTDKERCLTKGCNVRRACPISQKHNHPESQSAFHMKAFV